MRPRSQGAQRKSGVWPAKCNWITCSAPATLVRKKTQAAPYDGNHAAVGNYVAISATHYNSDGVQPGGLDGLHAPPHSLFGSYSQGNPNRTAGNGVIVFAQRTDQQLTDIDGMPLRSIFQEPKTDPKAKGLSFAIITDGPSHTLLFSESREECYASWISGLSAYVVAAGGEKIPSND